MLISHFYDQWLKGGLPPQEALRESQGWLRNKSRSELMGILMEIIENNGQMSSSEDAVFKRIVLEEFDEKPFSHPYYWAAFTYTGV